MSGHSKWSKVKHQKAGTDAVKSAAFTKASHAISVAVKEGGARLRLAIEHAKALNMPKDTIERAIKRGEENVTNLEQITFEGFGPGGVAFLIEVATDNHVRTVAEIKSTLEHGGGSLGSPGSVRHWFQPNSILPENSKIIVNLIEKLENLADVQRVLTNAKL